MTSKKQSELFGIIGIGSVCTQHHQMLTKMVTSIFFSPSHQSFNVDFGVPYAVNPLLFFSSQNHFFSLFLYVSSWLITMSNI